MDEALPIGQTIKSRRMELGFTQEELAEKIGISAPAISKWETGNSYPDITLLTSIAHILNISIDHLLGFTSVLSAEEREKITKECNHQFDISPIEEAVQFCEDYMRKYPNDIELKLHIGTILPLYSKRSGDKRNQYLEKAIELCMPASESKDIKLRKTALQMLSNIYIMTEQLHLAEKCMKEKLDDSYEKIDLHLAVIQFK